MPSSLIVPALLVALCVGGAAHDDAHGSSHAHGVAHAHAGAADAETTPSTAGRVPEDYIVEKARRAFDARQYLVTLVDTLNVTRAQGAPDGAPFFAVFSQQEAEHLLHVGANRDGALLAVTRDTSVDMCVERAGFRHVAA